MTVNIRQIQGELREARIHAALLHGTEVHDRMLAALDLLVEAVAELQAAPIAQQRVQDFRPAAPVPALPTVTARPVPRPLLPEDAELLAAFAALDPETRALAQRMNTDG